MSFAKTSNEAYSSGHCPGLSPMFPLMRRVTTLYRITKAVTKIYVLWKIKNRKTP
jgi:hypothetical protein